MSMFILNETHYRSIKRHWEKNLIGNEKGLNLEYWLNNFFPIHNKKGALDNDKCYAALDCIFDYLLQMNIECWNNKYNQSAPMKSVSKTGKYKDISNLECLNAMSSIDYQIEVEHIQITPSKKRILELLEYAQGKLSAYCLRVDTDALKDIGCWEITKDKL